MKVECKLCGLIFSDTGMGPSVLGSVSFAHLLNDHPEIRDELMKKLRNLFDDYLDIS